MEAVKQGSATVGLKSNTHAVVVALKRASSELSGKPLYHRERILETSTLSCNEEEEEITKPPKR
jgi:hypothetical protein